jgi:hypothetical protein
MCRVAELSVNYAQGAISWYLRHKGSKRLGARLTRLAAINLVLCAGLIPLLSQIFQIGGKPAIDPLWSSVALVLAVGSAGLDRFFGFSTCYMRYLNTELLLQRLTHEFQIDFQARLFKLETEELNKDDVKEGLNHCKEFVLNVHNVVQAETASWTKEFTAVIDDIDKSARLQTRNIEAGSVDVTISNGDQCSDGWQISLDGGPLLSRTGKSVAFKEVSPGFHVLTASGQIEGVEKRAEWTVNVLANAKLDSEATLS